MEIMLMSSGNRAWGVLMQGPHGVLEAVSFGGLGVNSVTQVPALQVPLDLNSIPTTYTKVAGEVVCTVKPISREVKAGGFQGLASQPI